MDPKYLGLVFDTYFMTTAWLELTCLTIMFGYAMISNIVRCDARLLFFEAMPETLRRVTRWTEVAVSRSFPANVSPTLQPRFQFVFFLRRIVRVDQLLFRRPS